ncbi:hypothetical protein ACFWZ2_35270 [Streptomyces sp. NPDC059002]|uniref:hypothetical protein n=1 Tax=Streptomyces sp. NPDC059002 TaxID=3346690 RepID=UPI0036ABE7D2
MWPMTHSGTSTLRMRHSEWNLNPAERICAELDRRTLANLAVCGLDRLISAMNHGLKRPPHRGWRFGATRG